MYVLPGGCEMGVRCQGKSRLRHTANHARYPGGFGDGVDLEGFEDTPAFGQLDVEVIDGFFSHEPNGIRRIEQAFVGHDRYGR